uniref:4Fe-4S binding domain-containing protein n=1 Tax=Candidatus Kentrum sp. DK TaxID=2126562 RepID=A0A450T7J9_9GAMM|nr:MAG: 4Fe-4S binding domain-containing protein [Candidatus Kentron sp. DK]
MNIPTKVPTLGKLRSVVQILSFVFLVYGGLAIGHYAAEKISGALPVLSCAYDQHNGGYCVLIPTQHQLHHRVGEALVRMQQFSFDALIPLLFTFLSFYLFFVVLNKAFCGWICPLGTFQEMLYKAGRRLGLKKLPGLTPARTRLVRPVKWLLLTFLVFLLPLLAGLGVTPHATGDAYCQICPSRLLTTLATGDLEQLTINQTGVTDMIFSAIRALLFGIVVVLALAVRQPFCRICPLLAFNALFRRLSPMRLVKRAHDKCEQCGICHRACPMDIHEIQQKSGPRAFHEDCTLCGRCAEYCPEDGVIQIKFGPLTLFRSSRDYYKRRIRGEKPDGEYPTVKTQPIPSGKERA